MSARRISTVIGLFFCLCLRLTQSGFHLIISNGVINAIARKLQPSDSCNSDSAEPRSSLTTPLFGFHLVLSTLTTMLMTLTRSLGIPALQKTYTCPKFIKIKKS